MIFRATANIQAGKEVLDRKRPQTNHTELRMFNHVLFETWAVFFVFCNDALAFDLSCSLIWVALYPKDTARPWRTSLSSHCTPWPHMACEIQSMRFGDPEMLKEKAINESLAVPAVSIGEYICKYPVLLKTQCHCIHWTISGCSSMLLFTGQKIWW